MLTEIINWTKFSSLSLVVFDDFHLPALIAMAPQNYGPAQFTAPMMMIAKSLT